MLARCRSAEAEMRARLDALSMVGAATMGAEPAIPALSDDLGGLIRGVLAHIEQRASALEASANEAARAEMIKLRSELSARSALAEVQGLVVGAIESMARKDALKACEAETDTRAISRKATGLARSMATPEVVAALNTELEALNCHELRVVVKTNR